MLKNDRWFRDQGTRVIEPFEPMSVTHRNGVKVLSYGTSSGGYDFRISDKEVFAFQLSRLQIARKMVARLMWFIGLESLADQIDLPPIDPKNFADAGMQYLQPLKIYEDESGRYVVPPPHTCLLGVSVERFQVPDTTIVHCEGKSSYARCGVIVFPTPLEHGWHGYPTLELAITTPVGVRIYLDEGLGQGLFLTSERCEDSYAQKGGKYQNQPQQVVFPKA